MTNPPDEPPVEPAAEPTAQQPTAAQPAAAQRDAAIFAPVPRPARVPWINPARRGHVLASAVIGALVVLGAGIGIGFAAAPSHHRHQLRPRMYDGVLMPHMRPGGLMPHLRPDVRRLPNGGIYIPPRHYPRYPVPSPTATPSPSPSHTK